MKKIVLTAFSSLVFSASFAHAALQGPKTPIAIVSKEQTYAPQYLEADIDWGDNHSKIQWPSEDPATISFRTDETEANCNMEGLFGSQNTITSKASRGHSLVMLPFDIDAEGGNVWIGIETTTPTNIHFLTLDRPGTAGNCSLMGGDISTNVTRKVIAFKWGKKNVLKTKDGEVEITINKPSEVPALQET